MKKITSFIVVFLTTIIPVISFARAPRDFGGVVYLFIDLVSVTIPVVAGLALLAFFWGLAKFILHADNEEGREEGKQIMKWGIVALFVMVSIWGIVSYLQFDLFGVTGVSVPQLPTVPTGN